MNPFKGTHTALVTPFRNDQVDEAALTRIVEHQLAEGVDGLVPCGTTGESPTLATNEYEQVVRCVVKARDASGRTGVTVMAGSGSNSTAKTIELSKRMADCGAEGLLVVAPYYNKPSQEGLFRHYEAVAKAVRLPIMLYNIPGRCGVEVSVETLRRLREACDNLVAVKHATGKVEQVSDLRAACDVGVLSGDDPLTLPMMSIGAVGVVSVLSNLVPGAVSRMTNAALKDDWKAAAGLHDKLYALGRMLLSLDTNPVPIKTAMAIRGFCTDELRLPMCPLSAENRKSLERLLAEMGDL